ncbi:MAG: c-type cytochrome [Methylococcales symbiont of Hymedesmia sp. n. MRB-2018]|nr:MAG: c-type cytochrome [Methylococcales symbiont of Hymedesmia sp. n. MRB-2018]KAF3983171.1 MAG: c-type cytochrome [Methylococcales symbiont of Hymedesmia sp. n. MRB-2018]
MPLYIIITIVLSFQVNANDNLGLPELNIPRNNLQSKQKIALGKAFFFDTRFSKDHSISCASCHQPDKAYTDSVPQAIGINGKKGRRNSPTLINSAFFKTLFLDGRENSLEQQALQPMLNSIEHGLENEQQILQVVLNDGFYKNQLIEIFNVSEQEIKPEHIAKAIASFERTLITGNSAFDQYYFDRDRNKLNISAARGLRIFRRKGNCANCHEISWNNALFTDNRFYNIGVGFNKIQNELDRIIEYLQRSNNKNKPLLTTIQKSELGRFNVTKIIKDLGKFKTPTLRNIALTSPYMHDGSMETLEQVVDYYDKGGNKNRFLDPAIFPLQLTDQEKIDLVAFMQSLTSSQLLIKK